MKVDGNKPEFQLKLKNEVYKKMFLVMLAIAFICYLFQNQLPIFTAIGKVLGIATPFIIGAGIAFVLKIPMNLLEEKVFSKIPSRKFQKVKRPIAILLTLVVIAALVALLLQLIVPQVVNSIVQLQKKLPEFTQQLIDKMNQIPILQPYAKKMQIHYDQMSWNEVFERTKHFFSVGKETSNSKILSTAVNTGFALANGVVGGLMTTFLALVSALYILGSKERLGYQSKRVLYSLFRVPVADRIKHVFHILHKNFTAFIRGQLVDSFCLGSLITIGSFIMQMPNAAMLGVLIGVTNLVPILGPIIGCAIGFVLIVIEDPTKAIIFVVFVLVMQQIEGNLVYPRLVGSTLGIPPLWTLVAITLGGSLFGVVGMWLFIPLASTLYALISEVTAEKINQKGIDMRRV